MSVAIGPNGNNPAWLSYAVLNGRLPSAQEGPRVMPLLLNFGLATSFLLDLKIAQQQARLSFVQTIYVDNTASAVPFTLQSQTVRQIIQIPAGGQGFVPVLEIESPVFTASSTGGVIVPIFLLNFPVSPAVWQANAPALVVVNGKLQVSDVILDQLVGNWNSFGNALAVADLGLQAQYTGGTPFSVISVASTMAGNIKASPGFVKSVQLFNKSAVPGFFRIFNTAGVPVAGAGTPVERFMIPGNAAGAGAVMDLGFGGINCPLGIGYTATLGIGDGDTTALTANDFIFNVVYN